MRTRMSLPDGRNDGFVFFLPKTETLNLESVLALKASDESGI